MAKTIDHLDFMVDVTPYEHEGNSYDALRISVTYSKGYGFYVSWMPVKVTQYGYQTGPMPSGDKLVGGVRFLVEQAKKNSAKRLTEMHAALELAKEGVALYFDKRLFEQLNNFMRYVALYGFTPHYQKQVENLKAAAKLVPVMRQYNDLKKKHPDAMLLFRCGDFYETYEDDAAEAAKVLGITLTKSTTTGVRMAGFPHHALDTYLPKLVRAGKRVAICDQLEDPKLTKKLVKRGITELVSPATNNNNNNNQTLEDKTMATKNNNESKNVQNAQVTNNANEAIDVNVGEVTVDSIMPVMQPADLSPDPSPKGEGSANAGRTKIVVAGVPRTKADVRCKKEDGSPQTSSIEHHPSSISPQTSSLPRVTLVVYVTKRGEQAPRIEGFGGENDPRWKRHYDDKVRLAQQKKEADAFNEKLTERMKGKPKAEREKLRKQWKSVGSDPFGASYFTDRTTGDKYYQMTMGAKYLDVARDLVDAFNSGDETAIAAAEQAVVDCKNGIVQDIEAQRAARQAEREAKKAAATDPSPKGEGSGYSDKDVADMLRKVLAGGDVPENIKKLLQAA